VSYNNFPQNNHQQNYNVDRGQSKPAAGPTAEGMHSANYFNQLSELMQNISDKGATVAQTGDGTVFIAETRIVVYKFIWDENKGTFVKQRTRNTRNSNKTHTKRFSEDMIPEMDEAMEDAEA